jgi:Flp pilus assembly protein TadG
MQPRAATANAADAAAGLVRDGGATVRNYNTSRQYATTSVADKLTEALSRMTTLQVSASPFSPPLVPNLLPVTSVAQPNAI